MQKKGQAGGGFVGIFMTIGVVAILAIIVVLIYSNVNSATDDLYAKDSKITVNETINVAVNTNRSNSTTLAEDGFVANTEIVANTTNQSKIIVRNIDYKITLMKGTSGELNTQANFTWIEKGYNSTAVYITYETKEESAIHKAKTTINTTALSGINLAIVGIIVLAAVGIIGVLFVLMKR